MFVNVGSRRDEEEKHIASSTGIKGQQITEKFARVLASGGVEW